MLEHMGKCCLHSPPERATALGFKEGLRRALRQQLAAGLEVSRRGIEYCCPATIESLGPLQGVGGHIHVEIAGGCEAHTPCKAGFDFSRFRRLHEDAQVGGGRSFIHRGFVLQRSGGGDKGGRVQIGVKGQVTIDPK